jgi:hypothetical protein
MKSKLAAKAAFVGLFLTSSIGMVWSGAAIAASGVNCNGVFPGKTPHIISKTADKSQAYAGQTVTFTIGFHSTGVATADVRDCYRVDGGSNATLNALVTGLNALIIHTNAGPKGTAQTVTFTITIPSDPSLIGHALVDRAKISHGSKESKSALVSVDIVAPPQQCETDCPNPTPTPTDTVSPSPSPTVGGVTFPPAPKPKPKPRVKGGQLAHTGPVSAKAAFLGSMLIMVGLVTRIRRPQMASASVETTDNSGSSYLARYDSYLQAALKHRSRGQH